MPANRDDSGAGKSSGPSLASRLITRLLGVDQSQASQEKPKRQPQRRQEAERYRFSLIDGGDVSLEVPMPQPVQGQPSTFVIGIYKGGSTLLNRMIGELLRESRRRSINMPLLLRKEGWEPSSVATDVDGLCEYEGVVYSGFRNCPSFLQNSPNFLRSNKLVMVRDPRDILVSLYFSHAYSHAIPQSGPVRQHAEETRERALSTSIDEYALENAEKVLADLMSFKDLLTDKAKLVRYEDVIFDKVGLAKTICETIGITIAPDVLAEVAARNDIRPEKEDKHAHIRNVSPGDHKNKLQPETVNKLNQILKPVFDLYYPDQGAAGS